jgi:hypothetical protein
VSKRLCAASKWLKHRIVHATPALRSCLPDTTTYSVERLGHYLQQYPVVFLKPALGTGGRKIFQVRKSGAGHYVVKMEHRQRTTQSLAEVDRWVKQVAQGNLYLIQRGISLAKWNGRPVDLRTILQVNEQGQWECTGMFSKSAGKNLAVTNVCIGGSAHTVEAYLQAIGYTRVQSHALMKRLESLSLGIVRPFGARFRNTIYGLDIGLDENGKLWLIEVNTVPTLYVFRKINRMGMYNRSKKLWDMNRVTNISCSPGLRKRFGWPLVKAKK